MKQEATQLDPRGDVSNALDIIQKLMDKDEVQSAVSLGKAFLKVSRYASSLEMFRYIERRIIPSHKYHPRVLAHLAYSLIGQKDYHEAIRTLLQAQRETPRNELGFWPALGLAYAYLKIGDKEEYGRWLSYAKSIPETSEYFSLVVMIYPEFKDSFLPGRPREAEIEKAGPIA
ncbi:MAG: hypothetical protein WBV94_00050 [Blastocatellia bacterium]